MKRILCGLACLWSACGDDLTPGFVIESDRVIGAKVEVDSDPTRVWPAPGETATVTLVTASDKAMTKPFSWAFAVCPGQGVAVGLDFCRVNPTEIYQGESSPPSIRFTVPSGDGLMGAKAMLLSGVVCVEGKPEVDLQARTARCNGSTETATVLQFQITIQKDAETNHNPNLSDNIAGIEGMDAAWTLPDPALVPSSPCDGSQMNPALPVVSLGQGKRSITFFIDNTDRETFSSSETNNGMPTLEALQLSQFNTAGELDGQFSIVEEGTPWDGAAAPEPRDFKPLTVSILPTEVAPGFPVNYYALPITWSPNKYLPKDFPSPSSDPGRVVVFTFVARDLRGGLDFTKRALCLIR